MESADRSDRRSGKGADPQHPWLGLSAFTFETQQYFFGRDEEIREVYQRVRDHSLTVLYGQSGLGKTSLLGAGLIPKLIVEGYRPVLIRLEHETGSLPLVAQVKKALISRYGSGALAWYEKGLAPEHVVAELKSGGEEGARAFAEIGAAWSAEGAIPTHSLWEMFHHRRQRPSDVEASPPVIILDQLEEIFTLADSDDRETNENIDQFFRQLAELVENRPPGSLTEHFRTHRSEASDYDYSDSPVRVVLTLREDFLSALEEKKKVMPSLMQNRMVLRRLNGTQALDAVVRPGRMGGGELVSVEVGSEIVRFVAKKTAETPLEAIQAVPPLLSLLCHELNDARLGMSPPGEVVTSELVESQGADILQNFYHRSFEGLDPAVRHFVEDRMLTRSGHRTPVAREDAEAELETGGVADPGAAIDLLISGRLLSSEDRGGLLRLEITHDVIAPLALASRNERHEREEAEAREQELREAKERERNSLRAKRRLQLTVVLMTLLALASIGGAIFGWIGMKRAEKANQEQVNMLKAASRSDHATAEQLFQSGDGGAGLAYLARALQFDPSNRLAMGLALSALQYGDEPIWRLAVGVKHEAPLTISRFSPEGSRFATASRDGKVMLWDTATGDPAGGPFSHGAAVGQLEFTPDGRRLVSGGADGFLRIWEVNKGEMTGEPLRHDDQVSAIAISRDGERLAASSADGMVRIWDIESGTEAVPAMPHEDEVGGLSYSPDGRHLATISGVSLQVWNGETGELIGEPLSHGGSVNSVEFSPDGDWIVTASADGTVTIWVWESRLYLTDPIENETEMVIAKFSPDGRSVAGAGADGIVRLWRLKTEVTPVENEPGFVRQTHSAKLTGPGFLHDGRVGLLSFSPDGRRLLATGADYSARVWEIATGLPVGGRLQHQDDIVHASFSFDGGRVLTASSDMTAKVWKHEPGQPNGLAFWHRGEIYDAVFSPDGSRMATVSDDNTARIWDLGSGNAIGDALTHDSDVVNLDFSSDGQWLVTGSNDRTARVWNAETGEPAGAPLAHKDYVRKVAFDAEAKRVITASWDRTARIWDVGSGVEVAPALQHDDKVEWAEFSPDGRLAVTASADFTAQVWDSNTGEPIGEPFLHQAEVLRASFSPDGKYLATVAKNDQMFVWEIETGQIASSPLGHPGKIEDFDFHPDDAELITACSDGKVRIWELAGGRRKRTPLIFMDPVKTVKYSPDGRWILTAAGTSAQVRDAVSGQFVSQPYQHPSAVNHAGFHPDGTQVITASSDHSARVWQLPARSKEKAPESFSEIAIPALTRMKIEMDGAARMLPFSQQVRLSEEFAKLADKLEPGGSDPYHLMMKWLAAESGTRSVSPGQSLTIPVYVERMLDHAGENPSAVQEAYELAPRHPLVPIALARFGSDEVAPSLRSLGMKRLLDSESGKQYGRKNWARFCRQAVKLLTDQGDFANAQLAGEKAAEIEGGR